jgi:hypothetical protein
MIRDEIVAREVSQLMLEIGARLDRSVELVSNNCSQEECKVYRRAVGAILGEILLTVLNPLYSEHPSLKPPELE